MLGEREREESTQASKRAHFENAISPIGRERVCFLKGGGVYCFL